MNKIEVKILNKSAIKEAENMMACGARLTQHGHAIKNMKDFMKMYNQKTSSQFIESLSMLPHPTLQKFTVINVAIVGASRRFLMQITRHQNEVKFMSASCQYSDYSNRADFVIPYELLDKDDQQASYIDKCFSDLSYYENLIAAGINHDSASYALPQSLRNILIISATPYQWKHMISQRVCRRNTDETRYIMLMIWKELYTICPELFNPKTTGPFCQQGKCLEGKMSCGRIINTEMTPEKILNKDFSKIISGRKTNEN